MEVILIANEKGGTAKTATALSLANCLTALGYRVLGVDLDPSGNFSAAALPEFPDKVLYDVLNGYPLTEAIVHTDICDVLPTIKDLDEALDMGGDEELEIADIITQMKERKSLTQLASSWVGKRNAEMLLYSLFWSHKYKLDETYDFIIMDTAPSDSILLTMAIVAANSVIVPCEPTSASVDGLHMFVASIHATRRCFRTNVKIDGILFTKYTEDWSTRRRRIEDIQKLAKRTELDIYNTKYRMSASVETSMNDCQPILNYIYKGTGASDAMNLTLEFLAKRGLEPKISFPGVFRDETGKLIYRKNGDKYFLVNQSEQGCLAQEKIFRQDYLSEAQWQERLGKTVFTSEAALRQAYPDCSIQK